MINSQWLKLPISRINFHGPKDVRATEVPLYILEYQLFLKTGSECPDQTVWKRKPVWAFIADRLHDSGPFRDAHHFYQK